MKKLSKRLLAAAMLLTLLCGICTVANADRTTEQDLSAYTYSYVTNVGEETRDDYKLLYYKSGNDDASEWAWDYYYYLDAQDNLQGLGYYDTGEWVHLCIGASYYYSYKTFRLTRYGTALTPYCSIIISYMNGAHNNIYVRYSSDITFYDLGYRTNLVPTPSWFVRGNTIQDPVSWSGYAISYDCDADKNGYLQKCYKTPYGQDSFPWIEDYAVMLMQEQYNLSYNTIIRTDNWCHFCFSAAPGYSYKSFHLISNGRTLTPDSVVIVSYEKNGSRNLYVRYSTDLQLGDLGFR